MDIQKVFNPLTGRMINASGATAKSIKQKQQKVSVLEAVIKRKLTKKPEPAPKPEKKKEEASKVLQGAVKRTLAKKPEPPKPEPNKITKYTKNNLQLLKKNVLRFIIIEGHEKLYNEDITEHLGMEWKKYTKEEMIDYILEPSQGGEYTFNSKYFDKKQMIKENIL
jgi:hypothetical protein